MLDITEHGIRDQP